MTNTRKETREEFEARYNDGDRSWAKHSLSIECPCDYEDCTGWCIVPISSITIWKDHHNTDAERAAALAHHEELLRKETE